jgi:hypothetical protein
LEPAAWILVIDPALLAPDRERLGGVGSEEVEFRVMAVGTEFGVSKPVVRELRSAVSHISAAEDAEPKQLLWRQIWPEARCKILSDGFGQEILITALHQIVVDLDSSWFRFHSG